MQRGGGREEGAECSNTVKQRMNPGGSNDEKLTNIGTTLSTSVRLSSLLPPTASVAVLASWLIYEWSDTVEQRMIYGSSIDERWTNVDTHNDYICKVAQYLTSHEALLHVFTHALLYPEDILLDDTLLIS